MWSKLRGKKQAEPEDSDNASDEEDDEFSVGGEGEESSDSEESSESSESDKEEKEAEAAHKKKPGHRKGGGSMFSVVRRGQKFKLKNVLKSRRVRPFA